jgi:hypothetical protein
MQDLQLHSNVAAGQLPAEVPSYVAYSTALIGSVMTLGLQLFGRRLQGRGAAATPAGAAADAKAEGEERQPVGHPEGSGRQGPQQGARTGPRLLCSHAFPTKEPSARRTHAVHATSGMSSHARTQRRLCVPAGVPAGLLQRAAERAAEDGRGVGVLRAAGQGALPKQRMVSLDL